MLRKCKKVQTVSVINIGQLNVRCKSCKRVTLVRSSTLLIYFNLQNQEKYSDPSLFVTTDLKTFIIKRMVQEQWILEFTLCNVVLMTVICGFFYLIWYDILYGLTNGTKHSNSNLYLDSPVSYATKIPVPIF